MKHPIFEPNLQTTQLMQPVSTQSVDSNHSIRLMDGYHRVVQEADKSHAQICRTAFATLKQRYREYANAFMKHLAENPMDGLRDRDWNTMSNALQSHHSKLQSKYDFMCDLIEKLICDHQAEMLRASEQRTLTVNQWYESVMNGHGPARSIRNGYERDSTSSTRFDPRVDPVVANGGYANGATNGRHTNHDGKHCEGEAVSIGSRSPSISSDVSEDDEAQSAGTNHDGSHGIAAPAHCHAASAVVGSDIVHQSGMSMNNLSGSGLAQSAQIQNGAPLFAVPPPPPPRPKHVAVKRANVEDDSSPTITTIDRKRSVGDMVSGDHGSSRPSKRRRVSVERTSVTSRDDEYREEHHRGRRERHKSEERRERAERENEDYDRSRDRDSDRNRSRERHRHRDHSRGHGHHRSDHRESRSRRNEKAIDRRDDLRMNSAKEYEDNYDFERHREEMKLIARKHRAFNLSQFDRVYIGLFKRSIRRLYHGRLKSLVSYFAAYFQIEQIQPLNQCNIRSLLYEFKRRRDDSREISRDRDFRNDASGKSSYFSSPRQRGRSRSPLLTKTKGKCSISGAWSAEGDEEVQMVMWEDFASHKVIGFMSFKGRSECTVHGMILPVDRNKRIRYDLTKVYHDDKSRSHYVATMSRDFTRVELVKETKGGPAKIQIFALTHKENIPTVMYHELMQLKHIHWNVQ